jgi:hypothetical protein
MATAVTSSLRGILICHRIHDVLHNVSDCVYGFCWYVEHTDSREVCFDTYFCSMNVVIGSLQYTVSFWKVDKRSDG